MFLKHPRANGQRRALNKQSRVLSGQGRAANGQRGAPQIGKERPHTGLRGKAGTNIQYAPIRGRFNPICGASPNCMGEAWQMDKEGNRKWPWKGFANGQGEALHDTEYLCHPSLLTLYKILTCPFGALLCLIAGFLLAHLANIFTLIFV